VAFPAQTDRWAEVNNAATPICDWLLTIFNGLFEGKKHMAQIANSR
jgi:hypothetical protein